RRILIFFLVVFLLFFFSLFTFLFFFASGFFIRFWLRFIVILGLDVHLDFFFLFFIICSSVCAVFFYIFLRLRQDTLFKQCLELISVQCFNIKQCLNHQFQLILVFCKVSLGTIIAVIDKVLHFLIDFICNRITVILIILDITAKEYCPTAACKLQRTIFITHAIFRNHLAYNVGCLLEVIMGSCTHFAEHHFFSDTAAQ